MSGPCEVRSVLYYQLLKQDEWKFPAHEPSSELPLLAVVDWDCSSSWIFSLRWLVSCWQRTILSDCTCWEDDYCVDTECVAISTPRTYVCLTLLVMRLCYAKGKASLRIRQASTTLIVSGLNNSYNIWWISLTDKRLPCTPIRTSCNWVFSLFNIRYCNSIIQQYMLCFILLCHNNLIVLYQ